jgi:hypothetical protein
MKWGWDWSRTLVDRLDVHVSDFSESVRFYETALAPLGIPKLFEREDEACFAHVNVVARTPPTKDLNLRFHMRSNDEIERPVRLRRPGVTALVVAG